MDSFVYRFVPHIYNENETMFEINKSQNQEIKNLDTSCQTTFKDTFISTSSINGIEKYEKVFSIVPDIFLDTIEFRRSRIIDRLSIILSFTKISLEQKLKTIFGDDNWILTIDNKNYTIFIETKNKISKLNNEMLLDVIPANMILATAMTLPDYQLGIYAGTNFFGDATTKLPKMIWEYPYEKGIYFAPRAESILETHLPPMA